MVKLNEVYKCNICGNIIQISHASIGTLICCGQPMNLLDEKSEDTGTEKHKPIIEKTKEGVIIKVGEVEHPMTEEHHIDWIEILADRKSYKVFLRPDQKPEAEFCIKAKSIIARAYCNLHGFWKS